MTLNPHVIDPNPLDPIQQHDVNHPRFETLLDTAIEAALERAMDNGYDLSFATAPVIAIDLINYDADFELYRPSELLRGIEAWRAKRHGKNVPGPGTPIGQPDE